MQASTTFRIRAALATPSETMAIIVGSAGAAGGWGGTAPTGGSPQGGPIGAGTGDCSGQITVTFTWNQEGDPNSLPPEAVIIKQTHLGQIPGSYRFGR